MAKSDLQQELKRFSSNQPTPLFTLVHGKRLYGFKKSNRSTDV